jgi:hypothetical protein
MIQETWLPSRCLATDGRSDSDIPAFSGTPQDYEGVELKENEVSWACSTPSRDMKCDQNLV